MIEKKSLAYLNIKQEDIGSRLDRILLKYFDNLSFIKIQKLIRVGFFKVNNRKVKANYKDFSNVIICIYSATDFGISIANGLNENISAIEKKKAWLAMYSYNPVEGEYFDDQPGGYLGAFWDEKQ